MDHDFSGLAAAIRAWRDRARPEDVGMPTGGNRRASGLRREELAQLAGLSVDYLVRLEQGRATNPSPQVLAALARGLRLSDRERDLLHRAAGVEPPSARSVPRHVGAGVQRILDRLSDTPACVFTAVWDPLVMNRAWRALFAVHDEPVGRAANVVWRFFAMRDSVVRRTDAESDDFAATMVADLHEAVIRYPHDRELAAFVRDLRGESPWFAALWTDFTVVARIAGSKTVDSPLVGLVTVDCDVLTVPESDLRMVVYTAAPSSEDARKLALLRVAGIQAL